MENDDGFVKVKQEQLYGIINKNLKTKDGVPFGLSDLKKREGFKNPERLLKGLAMDLRLIFK